MDTETLIRRITAAQHHLETLRQYASVSPDHQALVSESWRELDSTLHELRGAIESSPLQDDAHSPLENEIASLARFPSENPNPVLRLSQAGDVLYANEASKALLQEWKCAVGESAPSYWRGLVAEAVASRANKTVDIECGERVYSFFVAPIAEAGYVNLYGRDITELERAEQERERLLAQVEALARTLQRERDILETIMENTRTQLVFLDPQFNFVRVNSAYAQGSGHTKEELIGHNHFELFPSAENQAIFERVRDTGQSAAFHAKPFAYPDRPELGTMYWDWTLVPIRNASGRVEGLVLSLLDVTEHERVRQEREARLSHLGALVKASQHVLAETTVEGLLQRTVEAARELAKAKVGTSGLVKDDTLKISATLRSDDVPSCPLGSVCNVPRGGMHSDLVEKQASLRLTHEQLVQHPAWRGLPESHIPLRGLLGVRLVGSGGQVTGTIIVSHKEQGDFTAEDEALLTQLAALASLALQHIEAQADAECRAYELDAVFNAMTDAVVVYDAGGMPVRANPAAFDIYGLDLMTVDRLTLAGRLGVRRADGCLLTADDLPTARALRGDKVANEYLTFTDPQGRDRVVLASASPLLVNGNVSGAVAVWHDVTEREHIMAQLQNERARLRAIIENAPEAIVVADRQCRIILANPAAESLGVRSALYNPAESQIQCKVRYPDGTLRESSELLLARSAVGGLTLKNVEMTITHASGQRRVFLVSTAPIKDHLDKISGAVGVFEDITLREQMVKALEQSNRDMVLLSRLGQELGATLDLSQVLGRILEAINALIPAESDTIWLWDEEWPGWLVCRAAFTLHPEQSPVNMRLRAGEGVVGWVAEHRESATIPCLTEDPRFAPAVHAQTGSQARSILAVPLFVRDKVAGVLGIVDKSLGEFDARDRMLVETLAAAAAIAIENARLHDQAMQAAVAAERNRLARDLHDAVSQTLFSASVISETLPRLWKRDPDRVRQGLEQLHQLTRGALAEMRSLLIELRPAALVETDLGDLLHQLAEATMSRTRITVSVAVEGKRALPSEAQIALYRIAQEALNNVVKHARASRVTLSFCNRPEQVELRVKDDGRGFDPDRVTPGRLGLGIMRERAQSMGITLEITSQPGQGAEIVATWPSVQ